MTEEILLFTPNRWKDVQSPANKKYKTKSVNINRGKKPKKSKGRGNSKLPSILTSSKMYTSLYNNNESRSSREKSSFQFSTFAKKTCSMGYRSVDRMSNSKYQSRSTRNKGSGEDQNDVVHVDEWVDNIKFGSP